MIVYTLACSVSTALVCAEHVVPPLTCNEKLLPAPNWPKDEKRCHIRKQRWLHSVWDKKCHCMRESKNTLFSHLAHSRTSATDEDPRGESANRNPDCSPWGEQKQLAGISCCTLDLKTIGKLYLFSRLRDC